MSGVYRAGRVCSGWRCLQCKKEFRHHEKQRRTFVAFLAHRLIRHGRIRLHKPSIWCATTSTYIFRGVAVEVRTGDAA